MEVPPAVDSKYRFILLSAKRARQIQSGARPLIQTATKKPTKVAQLEVSGNLVPFENLQTEVAPEGEESPSK